MPVERIDYPSEEEYQQALWEQADQSEREEAQQQEMYQQMEQEEVYICNREFSRLGIERGDYFPSDKFSKETIEKLIKEGGIIKEEELE